MQPNIVVKVNIDNLDELFLEYPSACTLVTIADVDDLTSITIANSTPIESFDFNKLRLFENIFCESAKKVQINFFFIFKNKFEFFFLNKL